MSGPVLSGASHVTVRLVVDAGCTTGAAGIAGGSFTSATWMVTPIVADSPYGSLPTSSTEYLSLSSKSYVMPDNVRNCPLPVSTEKLAESALDRLYVTRCPSGSLAFTGCWMGRRAGVFSATVRDVLGPVAEHRRAVDRIAEALGEDQQVIEADAAVVVQIVLCHILAVAPLCPESAGKGYKVGEAYQAVAVEVRRRRCGNLQRHANSGRYRLGLTAASKFRVDEPELRIRKRGGGTETQRADPAGVRRCRSAQRRDADGKRRGILLCNGLHVRQRIARVEALVRGLGRIVSEARGHAGGALNISAEDLDGKRLIGNEVE